jgi:hypothetical protein
MTTYNIYGQGSSVESDDPEVVIELNDDETEIVSATSKSESSEDLTSIIDAYKAAGLSATDILARLAGSYGYVDRVVPNGEAAPTEEPSPEDIVSEEASVEEAVSAAVEPEEETAPGAEAPVEGESTAPPLDIEGTMAMTSDAGLVVTLLQKGEDGPVYRHGNEWEPVVNPSVFDGLTLVGVDEDSVATYDQYETNGMLAPISEYTPSADGPFWPDLVVTDDDVVLDEETGIYESTDAVPADVVTASVMLDGPEDLTAAIDAAIRDPDLRWYVERRVSALGLEASLPWLQN